MAATYGRNADTENSVKYWVREDDGAEGPTDLSKTGRSPSDIAEAVSKVLSK
jgi:hypothetical protein